MSGGFTIGGQSASYFGITLLTDPDIPMLPAKRDRMVSIPGKAGGYWFGADLEPLTFSLPCMFSVSSVSELDTAIRTFGRHLVDVDGNPRKLDFTFDHNTNIHYTVIYSGVIPFSRAVYGGSKFTLNLTAIDPYGRHIVTSDSETITTSGESFEVECDSELSTEAVVRIKNNGSGSIDEITILIEGVY